MSNDAFQQMIRAQQAAASGGSNKPAYLFGVIPLNMEVGNSLGLQGCAPLGKQIPALFSGSQKAANSAFLRAIQSIPEQLKECAANAGVMYAGDITHGSSLSSGMSHQQIASASVSSELDRG